MLPAYKKALATPKFLLDMAAPDIFKVHDLVGSSFMGAPKPVVVEGTLVDIDIQDMIGFTEEQKDFFLVGMKLKAQVLSSAEFRDRFFRFRATERGGKSLDEIYEGLILGNDRYGKMQDRDIDVLIHLYKGAGGTLGYHNACCLDTYTNIYFFDQWRREKYGPAILAGHTAHEYFHVMGYVHRYIKTRSLVYQSGYLVRDLARDVINGKTLTPLHRPPGPSKAA